MMMIRQMRTQTSKTKTKRRKRRNKKKTKERSRKFATATDVARLLRQMIPSVEAAVRGVPSLRARLHPAMMRHSTPSTVSSLPAQRRFRGDQQALSTAALLVQQSFAKKPRLSNKGKYNTSEFRSSQETQPSKEAGRIRGSPM
jgi:hypothetical protein